MINIWKIIIIIIFIGINVENYYIDDSNENIKHILKKITILKEFNKIFSNLYFLAKEGKTKGPSYHKNSAININKLNIGYSFYINIFYILTSKIDY